MSDPALKYLAPDWTVEIDDDGMVKLIKFHGEVVGRVLEARLVASTDSQMPRLHLEITGPIRIERVEGALCRERVSPATGATEHVTSSPTLKVTNG